MNKKYELTSETKVIYSRTLHRIIALRDFGEVKKGDLGGWIEKEENLSHEGDCWVTDDGRVTGNGRVFGNGHVSDNGWVYGNGCVSGNGWVYGNGRVFGNGCVSGNGRVSGNGWVSGNGCVSGNGWVYGNGCVSGNGWVYGNGCVSDNGWVYDNGCVFGDAHLSGNGEISGHGFIKKDEDYAIVQGFGTEHRSTTFFRCKDGRVRVQCGCFYGSINQFRKQVKKTRKGKVAEEYLVIADLMEKHFSK